MLIRVYTKPLCQPCKAVQRHLHRLQVPFEAVDVTESQTAQDSVTALGYSSVPVVVVDADTHWFGYSPDRLDALKLI